MSDENSKGQAGFGWLFAGGLAAILASTCCVGPVLLLALGLGGVGIGRLAALEAYRPFFLGAALLCVILAYQKLFRMGPSCEPDRTCATGAVRIAHRKLFWLAIAMIGGLLIYPYISLTLKGPTATPSTECCSSQADKLLK